MAEQEKWQVYIARHETLGGRALRRQLSLAGDTYKVLEETTLEEIQKDAAPRGLLLPFLEIGCENQAQFLPEVDRLLQAARSFERTVLMLQEPLPELMALLKRCQNEGLACTAVCAGKGELYGGERPGELSGVVEELLDLLSERTKSASPRKRVQLPCREDAILHLLFVGELAGAALFSLRRYPGLEILLSKGAPCTYGELARLAGKAAGFAGKFQFGKSRLPKAEALPAGIKTMSASCPYQLTDTLPYLAHKRERQGQLMLSACVIMRDSEAEIGRCLESLAAADEIIVVDTGSVDKSVEIARRYTDKVYHFEWINDFAAAKNYALDKASGDWIVFIDSDEFFSMETAPHIHRLAEDYDTPGQPRHLFVRRKELDKNLHSLDFEETASRFFSKESRFLGAVHETLITAEKIEPAGVYVPKERCLLMHTGYDPAKISSKIERNMEILRQAHEAGNSIPLHHYNMGKMLMAKGRHEDARAEMIMARQAKIMPATLKAEIYRVWYNASQKLGDKKAMSEAMAAMRQDMPQMPDSYLVEGRELWALGKQEEAAPLLMKALELSRNFQQLNPGETNDMAKEMPAAAEALAYFYRQKGETGLAAKVAELV